MIYMAEEFWKRVNSLIKTKGMVQQEVAEKCNINYQTFRGWVTHKTYPSALQAYDIASALGVSVEYLVSGSEQNVYKDKFTNLVKAVKELPVD